MSWSPRCAMVLAAGLGKRMRPLSDYLPKPLVAVAGRPLIDHVLDRLVQAGVERVVVNAHYRAEQLIAHLERRERPQILISDERDALLDSGGGVRKALPLLNTEPFLIHNCDSIWVEGVGSNIARLSETWDSAAMDALLLLAPVVTSLGYAGRGDFALDAEGKVRRRREHEVVPFAFSGVSIMHPRLIAEMPEGVFSLNRPWDMAMERGRLYGVRMQGQWMHVGDPAAVADAEQYLASAHDP